MSKTLWKLRQQVDSVCLLLKMYHNKIFLKPPEVSLHRRLDRDGVVAVLPGIALGPVEREGDCRPEGQQISR